MIGEKWPNRFSLEMFVYLLRFSDAEPQTPAAFRPHLQQVTQYFISRYQPQAEADFVKTAKAKATADSNQDKAGILAQPAFYARDSLFSAFLSGNFLREKRQSVEICQRSMRKPAIKSRGLKTAAAKGICSFI